MGGRARLTLGCFHAHYRLIAFRPKLVPSSRRHMSKCSSIYSFYSFLSTIHTPPGSIAVFLLIPEASGCLCSQASQHLDDPCPDAMDLTLPMLHHSVDVSPAAANSHSHQSSRDTVIGPSGNGGLSLFNIF